MRKTLYTVIGATASGKTAYAIDLAKKLNTEIVSADSRQIFKEMNIGVARPSEEELSSVKHHLIASWSITENYNAARYEKEAIAVINQLFTKYDDVILCGGSGMYINAVINGIDDMPDTPTDLRNTLNGELKSKGLEILLEELKAKDEKYYAEVDKQNPRRVLRALEVIRLTGKPFSSFRKNENTVRNFDIKIIGLQRSREELTERINKRTDIMIKDGLTEEVRSLIPFKSLPALSTVGYRELFDYFDNKISFDQAVELIKIHTRQYAKRQMTWFRKTENVQWLTL
ncbi:MAG: tRNA (adenosine(37)-N6)-dimethylallyltransferase MiaA [Bacteroidales bacterium]|nr:tRNA (adenosine(37)-N6)-dimethylallyltransferase MiaA [Bacteroidales bacterium]